VYVLSVHYGGVACDTRSFFQQRDAIAMIDDTLEKRGQLQLIYNQPLKLVDKRKSRVSGSAKVVEPDTLKVPSTQPSTSRPKTAPGPQVPNREGVRDGNVPSSSTSARGRTTEMPAPRKRPSDAPSSAMKRQKTGKYPGCPVCEGPHHLVKDCPVTREGPKRYVFRSVTFTRSLLITLPTVYMPRSPGLSLNQGKLPLSRLSVKF
jgi:hypothetical protein